MALGGGTELGDGRYLLEEHLGSGGMASVWLATDERLGRRVAVKVMSDLLAHDERWVARFEREARAAASLNHPNIVKVFDFGIDGDRPYIVMAHIAGGSLKERLADRDGSAPPAETLARELLGALAHVHAAGILHRDVKPGNVLLDHDGGSHLTDFGIARPDDATEMTQTGIVMGTMKYLAPEVVDGEPATRMSDLYAAGCVLREAAGDDPGPRLAELIAALTANDPAARPASAEEALRRLSGAPAPDTDATHVMAPTPRAAATEATVATAATGVIARPERRPPGRPGPAPGKQALARARRSPWLALGAALAAIVLVAVLVVTLASGGGAGGDQGTASPGPAPASAPLEEQLRGLDRMIDAAARSDG